MPAEDVSPAATVVIVRDNDVDGIEVLMVRRNSKHAFGGMWVFPGGKVDPDDTDPDQPDDEPAAARRAAVREALEEAGIVLDPERLVPFAHWTPPPEAPRKFTTWFFAVEAPDEHEVAIDGDEIQDHAWITPAAALTRADAQEIELAPPTWMTLHALTAHAVVAAALEAAAAAEPARFATRIGRSAGGPVAMWDGDAGYLDGDTDRPGPRHRLYMTPGGWRYESSAAPA